MAMLDEKYQGITDCDAASPSPRVGFLEQFFMGRDIV